MATNPMHQFNVHKIGPEIKIQKIMVKKAFSLEMHLSLEPNLLPQLQWDQLLGLFWIIGLVLNHY